MPQTIGWPDHLVIVLYLLGMLAIGYYSSRGQHSAEEYFLGGRRLPWFAVGLSVIATLLSSLTYLSEPGEVWKSGLVNFAGKMLAIPLEMLLVWSLIIPFLMRFRLTSVYEYLGLRFGRMARCLGVLLFAAMALSWMGVIVLATARALEVVTGMPLNLTIAAVGVVSTVYTVLGGMRAVVWTDVAQVLFMMGGATLAIGYVAWTTHSGPLDWWRTTLSFQQEHAVGSMPWISFDPFVRSSMASVALSMFCWHCSTHLANQMSVQRYFSTSSLVAARRSFITGSLFGVAINLLLVVTGVALLHFYVSYQGQLTPEGLDPIQRPKEADLVFPTFVVHRLQGGIAGAIIAAVLAAAMSSFDSGISALSAVLSVERRDWHRPLPTDFSGLRPFLTASETPPPSHTSADQKQMRQAQRLTLVLGGFATALAYLFNGLPNRGNLVEMMATTFNSFTGALGGLFFIGLLLPRAGQRVALAATLCGLATSILLGYGHLLVGSTQKISFTWVVPGSLAVTLVVAAIGSLLWPAQQRSLAELSLWGRSPSAPETEESP